MPGEKKTKNVMWGLEEPNLVVDFYHMHKVRYVAQKTAHGANPPCFPFIILFLYKSKIF